MVGRWSTVESAIGAQVRVWYDRTVAGDQAIAAAVSKAIHDDVWPALVHDSGVEPPLADSTASGCDGGDSRHDVYLVHGINAHGLGSPIAGAASAGYDTTVGDQGKSVAAVVTASNSAGSASATSAAVPVPVPGTPTAPSLAFTATPTSATQGQPAKLAWSTTNASTCTASGGWSGSRAVSGSAVVTPAFSTGYTLACTGSGGTASATVNVAVTAPPAGSNPTLGGHGLAFHISQGSVGAWLSVPAMSTQSGSTMLAFVGKGSVWNLSPPIDDKGNTPNVQVGPIHKYTKWPGEGTAIYAFNTIVCGTNHIVSVDDANVWDEVTFAAVEVRNGGLIQDFKWNEVLRSATQTSLSITTTGPATLVAV